MVEPSDGDRELPSIQHSNSLTETVVTTELGYSDTVKTLDGKDGNTNLKPISDDNDSVTPKKQVVEKQIESVEEEQKTIRSLSKESNSQCLNISVSSLTDSQNISTWSSQIPSQSGQSASFQPKVTHDQLTKKKGWDKHDLPADQFGAYMKEKQRKLREQFKHESKKSTGNQLFQGVAVWVDGRTSVTRLQIRKLIMEGGGVMETYPTSKVTHVVADCLAHATRKRFLKRSKSTVKYVTAEWITQSLKQGKRLPELQYPVPGMIEKGQKSIADMFGGGKPKGGIHKKKK